MTTSLWRTSIPALEREQWKRSVWNHLVAPIRPPRANKDLRAASTGVSTRFPPSSLRKLPSTSTEKWHLKRQARRRSGSPPPMNTPPSLLILKKIVKQFQDKVLPGNDLRIWGSIWVSFLNMGILTRSYSSHEFWPGQGSNRDLGHPSWQTSQDSSFHCSLHSRLLQSTLQCQPHQQAQPGVAKSKHKKDVKIQKNIIIYEDQFQVVFSSPHGCFLVDFHPPW